MKKIILVFIICLLFGCSLKKEDYYNLSIDDYSITVGYDDYDYLSTVFDIGEDEFTLVNKHFANYEYGIIDKKEVITYLEFYTKDFGSIYKIDGIELSKSIKQNCESLAGEYIDKKTKGCIIQKQVGYYTNVCILLGDILNDNLDYLSKIQIYLY